MITVNFVLDSSVQLNSVKSFTLEVGDVLVCTNNTAYSSKLELEYSIPDDYAGTAFFCRNLHIYRQSRRTVYVKVNIFAGRYYYGATQFAYFIYEGKYYGYDADYNPYAQTELKVPAYSTVTVMVGCSNEYVTRQV